MPKGNPGAYRRGGTHEGQGPAGDPYSDKMAPQARATKRRNPATSPRNEASYTNPGATPAPMSSLRSVRAGKY